MIVSPVHRTTPHPRHIQPCCTAQSHTGFATGARQFSAASSGVNATMLNPHRSSRYVEHCLGALHEIAPSELRDRASCLACGLTGRACLANPWLRAFPMAATGGPSRLCHIIFGWLAVHPYFTAVYSQPRPYLCASTRPCNLALFP